MRVIEADNLCEKVHTSRAFEMSKCQTTKAARAATFRRLAKGHAAAGSLQICAKVTEGAADFEAQAAAHDEGKHAARSVRDSLS
jgi:hypothetical protein